MRRFIDTIECWVRRAGRWTAQAEGWQLALAAVAALMLWPAIPAVLFGVLLCAVVLLVRAWIREFAFLMRLGDDAFPGRNDKLIWAVLMIVLPPVGLWLFRAHRLAEWPESEKPASVADELA